MKFAGYILTYTLIRILHALPDRVLYFFSDGLYLLAYHLIGYRKKVVFGNLERAFPERTPGEIKQIARKFYHHLCDLVLESAVSMFFSREEAQKKISCKNPELVEELYQKGKQVIAVTGHYGNWELLPILGLLFEYRTIAVYKPLRNEYFNRFILKNREKFGATPVPMEQVARTLMDFRQKNILTLSVFLSDQRPLRRQIQYWTRFMGMDTPMYLGVEKLSKKLDAAVIFIKIRKVRRGQYEAECEMVCENPSLLEPYQITGTHVRILEALIRERPELWLWSHRRWRYTRDDHGG